MTGASHFNQVLPERRAHTRQPAAGAVGDGWKVAMTTLMNERFGTGGGSGNLPTVQELLALARSRGRLDSPGVQGPLARWYAQQQGMKYLRMRSLTALSRGETRSGGRHPQADPVAPMMELSSFAFDLEDQASLLPDTHNPGMARLQHHFLHAAALRIAGGTDEVLPQPDR